MSVNSPSLHTSIQLLGYSIKHFNGMTRSDRRLVLSHLSNAVEMLLKHMVFTEDISILKDTNTLSGLLGYANFLKSRQIEIPYLNQLEQLVETTNALQRNLGLPSKFTTKFYLSVVQDFFREVLNKHYGESLDELLPHFCDPSDLLLLRLLDSKDCLEFECLKKFGGAFPLGVLLSAIKHLEVIVSKFCAEIGITNYQEPLKPCVLAYLELNGIDLPEGLKSRLNHMYELRNVSANGQFELTKQDVCMALSSIRELENFLIGLDENELRNQVMIAWFKNEVEPETTYKKPFCMSI